MTISMRRAPLIIITVVLVIIALVALNAASYFHESERVTDTEANPNRSTHNAGATGARALYDLLYESGERVVRWREPPAALFDVSGVESSPHTFIIIGQTRVPYSDDEIVQLQSWVASGGRLVIIDRSPDARWFPVNETGGRWRIVTDESSVDPSSIDAGNDDAITQETSVLAPGGLTMLTRGVEEIQPSRLASRFRLLDDTVSNTIPEETSETSDSSDAPEAVDASPRPSSENRQPATDIGPPPPPAAESELETSAYQAYAPVAQFTDSAGRAALVEYAFGEGRVILLSDPFIVSNIGLARADNLQLALNIVGSGRRGIIAFDEFHQGYGATRNETFAYFAGTPVLAFALQIGLIALAVVWTRGRRWGRSLPLERADRSSKLEFIGSVAELQSRARAFDLAIENIYGRVRRALARFGGARTDMPRREIAARVAARSGTNREQIETLMRECEEVINGAPTNGRKSLALVTRLRELERTLNLQMRHREIKQAGKR